MNFNQEPKDCFSRIEAFAKAAVNVNSGAEQLFFSVRTLESRHSIDLKSAYETVAAEMRQDKADGKVLSRFSTAFIEGALSLAKSRLKLDS